VIETYFTAPRVLDRMRSGPMAPYLDELAAELQSHSYSRKSVRRQLRNADAPRGSLENRPMRITSKAANGREAGQGCYTAPEPSTAIQFRVRG
jgi:hypothetical protein